MNNNIHVSGHPSSRKDSLILAVLIGSLWGLSEAVLGPVIRHYAAPLRAALLTGTGMAWLGIFLALSRRPGFLFITALITMAAMHISVPVLQCSFLCKANSSLAVMLHGSALFTVITITGTQFWNRTALQALAGFGAPLLSGTLFFYSGMRLAPCAYLLSYNHGSGLSSFFMHEILLWSLFSMLLLPAGFAAGNVCRSTFVSFRQKKPALCVSGSLAAVFLCWVALVFIAVSGS
ncbi:MAG TPA: hypothetical protein PK544_00115 [Spirochaetota bacterium]|nr:hypothetical protein [Spirochaetota bacterium]HPJ37790.1 hypothetical protein [Spirochaetota bacterium]